jgi:tRNA(Ile)-lysidine synthase
MRKASSNPPFTSTALALTQQVEASLQVALKQQQGNPAKILLALSGGLDSCVLLHILLSLQKTLPFHLFALHVHHGLSRNADNWAKFCQQLCEQHQISCQIAYVKVDRESAAGIEGEARKLRYQALLAQYADLILLAHHQDDQAETLLLQLMRGSGVKGLAGMAQFDQDRRLLRPLLQASRQQLQDYAAGYALQWVEDESNTSLDYERNFVRHQIMPLLRQRNPAVSENIARSAALLAEAQVLLEDLAVLDAHENVVEDKLNVNALSQLSPARAANLLRWWLSQQGMLMPSQVQLQEMLQQLLCAKSDKQLQILLHHSQHDDAYLLRRFQGFAYISLHGVNSGMHLSWHGEEQISLEDGSRLLFSKTLGQGLSLKHIENKSLSIQFRAGGERFKPYANRPSKPLKKWLQEINMPPWFRERLPMVFVDQQLVLVPSLGVQAEWQAQADEMGLTVEWQSQ